MQDNEYFLSPFADSTHCSQCIVLCIHTFSSQIALELHKVKYLVEYISCSTFPPLEFYILPVCLKPNNIELCKLMYLKFSSQSCDLLVLLMIIIFIFRKNVVQGCVTFLVDPIFLICLRKHTSYVERDILFITKRG